MSAIRTGVRCLKDLGPAVPRMATAHVGALVYRPRNTPASRAPARSIATTAARRDTAPVASWSTAKPPALQEDADMLDGEGQKMTEAEREVEMARATCTGWDSDAIRQRAASLPKPIPSRNTRPPSAHPARFQPASCLTPCVPTPASLMDNHHAPGPGPMSVPVPGSSANPPKAADDDGISSLPPHAPPKSLETTDETRLYRLVCVQQPRRARMCGFGDKDRRPITPPPCIRLTVIEKATGQEVGCNDIEHQMFVLSVDLWTYDGRREVNLVRHSQNSPSISSTTQTSFRELQEAGGPAQYETHASVAPMGGRGQGYAPPAPHYGQSAVYGAPSYGQGPPADSYSYAGHVGQYHIPHSQMSGHALPPLPSPSAANGFPGRPGPDLGRPGHLPTQQHNGYASRYAQDLGPQRAAHLSTQQNTGMYTRNLIGSLVTSAARLIDDNEKDGIWFVLQDLSVRTEGFFRLRFSFTSVGVPNTSGDASTSDPQRVNKGKAPVLAMCFSEPFQVYSAKKFPGVCESTSLSKCFANQGIKIPIRKEGEGKGKRRVGSDDEDEY